MTCEEVHQKIRLFLDDLLEESIYQDIHRHLDQCSPCHDYASAVGALTYQLHELGQVRIPPDIMSTLLYTLGRSSAVLTAEPDLVAVPSVTLTSEKTHFNFFWILVAVVFLVAGLATGYVLWNQHRPAAVLPNKVSETAPSLPKVLESTPAEASKLPAPPHRHYHLYSVTEQELSELIDSTGFPVLFRSSGLVVMSVPEGRYSELVGRLGSMGGVVKEFNEEVTPESGQTVLVSIFLE